MEKLPKPAPVRFLILGNDAHDGIANVSARRTARLGQLIEQMGGRLCEAYATLGQYDIALIVDLPGHTDALQLSAQMRPEFGIATSSPAAIPMEAFDRMAEKLATEIESARMEAREQGVRVAWF
jgi:uncharacterized protein with GYD domain